MGLDVIFFNILPKCDDEIDFTIPCLIASRANPRCVQSVIGKPYSDALSQDSAMIRYHCSGVIVSGVPGRGRSFNRSSIGSDFLSNHRLIQMVTD